MTSEKLGIFLKKSTRIKLALALVLSNLFFFLLFGGSSEVKQEAASPAGWVEVQLEADLLTPFHFGKKVLIVHRTGRKKIEGVLQASAEKLTVLVKEDEAHTLFQHHNWEVLPYLKNLTFAYNRKETHEIRY